MIDWKKNTRWMPYIKQTPERKKLAEEVINLLCVRHGWVGENTPPIPIIRSWRKTITKWTTLDIEQTIEEYKRVIALPNRR